MNPLGLLVALLAYNYRRHRRGLPTICSTGRRIVPPWPFLLTWAGFAGWMVWHVLTGYPVPETEPAPARQDLPRPTG